MPSLEEDFLATAVEKPLEILPQLAASVATGISHHQRYMGLLTDMQAMPVMLSMWQLPAVMHDRVRSPTSGHRGYHASALFAAVTNRAAQLHHTRKLKLVL